ncbi:MAG: hypothetical protein P8185_19700 [Deltaproteobacteria bacterium]
MHDQARKGCGFSKRKGAVNDRRENRKHDEITPKVSSTPLTVMMVFGVGWECVKNYVDPQMTEAIHLSRFGHKVSFIEVETLSSSARNARIIREAVMATPEPEAGRRLVLLGYSKGAPDILEAIAAFPDLQQRVAAVVSVAGAVGGSPLANYASQSMMNLLQ